MTDDTKDEVESPTELANSVDQPAVAAVAPPARPTLGLGDLLGEAKITQAEHTKPKHDARKGWKPKRTGRPAPLKETKPRKEDATSDPVVNSAQGPSDGAGPSRERISLAIDELDTARLPAIRRKAPSSFLVFVALAIVGSFVLIVPQSFGFSGIFKFFFAIAMVAVYGVAGLMLEWYQPKKGGQRYVDNVYFLGFLYTQVGLVAGFMELWQSSTVDANGIRRITSDELIPIIGAALGASALGLLLKTVLDEVYELRVTSDSVSDEEKWRDELAKSAEKLKIEVDGVIDHFRELATKVVGATKDLTGAVTLASSTASSVEKNSISITAAVSEIRPALENFHSTLVRAGDQAATGILNVHSDLSSASKSLQDVARAAGGMESIVSQMDSIVGQMGGVLQDTKSASQVARQASDEFNAEARRRVAELASRLEDLTRSTSQDARNGFASSVQRMEADLDRTREALGQHVQKFAAAVKDFNAKVDERR